MDVEVDLFSGRPNPRFSLDEATSAEFLRRVSQLEPLPSAVEPPEMLGYRGLKVVPDSSLAFTEMHIYGGTAREQRPDGSGRALADSGRALERWLIDVGAGKLEPGVLAAVRQDLDQPGSSRAPARS